MIATIINFCTIENRFIKNCIEQCRHFSSQIIIPVCDHFFNGTIENHDLLKKIYSAFPDCLFVEYPFVPKLIPKRMMKEVTEAHFWPCVSRLVGAHFLKNSIEAVLFLDADELPDGKKFHEWLKASDYAQNSVMKMANYWYFREPCFQSLHWEDSVVLALKRALSPSIIVHASERDAIYDLLPGPKRRLVTGPDGQPMFHHFSWVRTKGEMLNKVRSWSHREDRNWEKLVEDEFAAPFSGKDFVHGYSFRDCKPLFEISTLTPDFAPQGLLPQLRRLTEQELLERLEIRRNGFISKVLNFAKMFSLEEKRSLRDDK